MKYCKDCKYYKKGFCKKVKYNVSINANFCKHYRETLITRLVKYIKKINDKRTTPKRSS